MFVDFLVWYNSFFLVSKYRFVLLVLSLLVGFLLVGPFILSLFIPPIYAFLLCSAFGVVVFIGVDILNVIVSVRILR